jgi:non-heme chloroperoxidase
MQHAGPKLRFASTVLGTGPKVHYAEQGHPEGEAIVLVHGWPDSWFSFSPVLAMLPTHYHAVAFDQRGFGNSERPACCYGIDDLAADLVVFLDAVGLRRASLVGHSLGSFIARRVAETRPERVARLVLISSAVTAANKARARLASAWSARKLLGCQPRGR